MLDGLKGRAGGAPLGTLTGGPVEVLITNGTTEPTRRFAILGIDSPFTTFEQNANLFFDQDSLRGITPAADAPFVVVQLPLSVDGIGVARIAGQTRCQVNLTNTSHTYAGPTTSTTELTSDLAGSARILWCESDFTETGSQWAVVQLLGVPSASGSSFGPTFGSLGTISSVSGSSSFPNSISIASQGIYILTTNFGTSGTSGTAGTGNMTTFIASGITGGVLYNSGTCYLVTGGAAFNPGVLINGSQTPTYFVAVGPSGSVVSFTAGVSGSPGVTNGYGFSTAGGYALQRLSGPPVVVSLDGGTW